MTVVAQACVKAAPVVPLLFPHPAAYGVTTLQAPALTATPLPVNPPARHAPMIPAPTPSTGRERERGPVP